MKKRIALPCLPLFEGHGVLKTGHAGPDYCVTPLGDLNSNWDFNKLFGAMLPNHANAVYPIISWLLDLKNQYTAELSIKGSFLLHIANQFSTYTPSDFDAIFVISGSRNNGESILQTMISRTAHVFGYQSMTEAQFSDMFYLKILRNDHGFSLKTSSGFYRNVQSPLYGTQPFPSYLPIDIDVVLTDEDPRKTMLKLWTMDSLNTSHRLIYPISPQAKAEIVTRVIPLTLIESLLAKNLLLVGPFPNTLDLFRLIKFRQRGYAFIEPNLEKKCIENTISSFTGISVQDGFLQRSKGVLTAITKKQDKASLGAFCDIFDKLYTVLTSRQVHQRMHASLLELKNDAQSVLARDGVTDHASVRTFFSRVESLTATFGQMDMLKDQPQLLALAGYVLISDLSDTAPESLDAAAVVTAIYGYLDPKDFREQQIADTRVLACLKHFGVNVSDTVFEAIGKPAVFPTQSLAAHDHTVLSLLSERGSYPARLALKKDAFFEKKEHAVLARKQRIFTAVRHESATAQSYKAMGKLRIKRHFFSLLHQKTKANKMAMQKVHSQYQMKQIVTKWHTHTVENRMETRLNRLQTLYQKRVQLAQAEMLKTAFLQFKDSANAICTRNLKTSFLDHLATTGFVADSTHTTKNLEQHYEKFLKTSLSQTAVLQELETFIAHQIPAITFIRNTLKKDISDIFLAKTELRFISQPSLDRLNDALNAASKINNAIDRGYWSVAKVSVLEKRIKELETHISKKSGLTDKFCSFFYDMESKHQCNYIRHFSENKNVSWATPILKALFLNSPGEFLSSFSTFIAPDKMAVLFSSASKSELEAIVHDLFDISLSANATVLPTIAHAQGCFLDMCVTSGVTPKHLLDTFGKPLRTLIEKSEFEDRLCTVAIKKFQSDTFSQNTLRGIQFTAIVLLCISLELYRNSKYQGEAVALGLLALFYLKKSFQYEVG